MMRLKFSERFVHHEWNPKYGETLSSLRSLLLFPETESRKWRESMACRCGEAGERTPTSRDRIMLRGMLFHGHHGVFVEENKLGQKFMVDVDAWMDLRKAGESDEMADSVSYADMYKQIKAIVEGPPFKLVESVANAIAKALLSAHPSVSDVRVKVCKPHVAVEGVLDHLGVEIFRSSRE